MKLILTIVLIVQIYTGQIKAQMLSNNNDTTFNQVLQDYYDTYDLQYDNFEEDNEFAKFRRIESIWKSRMSGSYYSDLLLSNSTIIDSLNNLNSANYRTNGSGPDCEGFPFSATLKDIS